MENNRKLKWHNIKNRACYYFDDIIKFEDFDLDNILIDGKSKKRFFYKVSYKTLIYAKRLRISKVKTIPKNSHLFKQKYDFKNKIWKL